MHRLQTDCRCGYPIPPSRHTAFAKWAVLWYAGAGCINIQTPGVMDFQVFLHPGKAGSLKMEIQVQTCDKRAISKEEIRKTLSLLLQTAIDRGGLSLGAVQTKAFEFKDTYTGKRRIQDFTLNTNKTWNKSPSASGQNFIKGKKN